MSKHNRRPQASKAPKSGNSDKVYVQHMQDIRRSSATSRHGSAADYRRKPKHTKRGWE